MSIECQNQTRHPDRTGQQCHAGFTLVELMVVVAVIGILAIVATPAMSELVRANRANGAAGELTAALQLARSEAVRRNVRVEVCGSADGATCSGATDWSAGWIAHGNNSAGADEVIRSDVPSGAVQVSGPADGIDFRPSGVIDAQTALCTNAGGNERQITVLISGVISTQKGCD